MEKKKKIILFIIGSLILLSLAILSWYLISNIGKKNYPKEPIAQESLPAYENRKISLTELKDNEQLDYKLWSISSKTNLEGIEKMIDEIGLVLEIDMEKEGEYYLWGDLENDYFEYYLSKNSLIFNIEDGIAWDEAELTANSFSEFAKKYLGKDWKYEIVRKDRFSSGYIYYAKRLLETDSAVETMELHNETDYLMMQNGKIMFGEFLLTEFVDTKITIPLIKLSDLNKVLNLSGYPKIISSKPSEIAVALSIEDNYLNEEILDIQEGIRDCSATNYNIVYLYKTFAQSYLTPVYKLSLECKVDYNSKEYQVPAIGYVNAINMDYVYTPE